MKTPFDELDIGTQVALRQHAEARVWDSATKNLKTIYMEDLSQSALQYDDKLSYFAWLGDWKRDYLSLSDEIRELRRASKHYVSPSIIEGTDRPTEEESIRRNSQSNRYFRSLRAYFLLQIRQAAKVKSRAIKEQKKQL